MSGRSRVNFRKISYFFSVSFIVNVSYLLSYQILRLVRRVCPFVPRTVIENGRSHLLVVGARLETEIKSELDFCRRGSVGVLCVLSRTEIHGGVLTGLPSSLLPFFLEILTHIGIMT